MLDFCGNGLKRHIPTPASGRMHFITNHSWRMQDATEPVWISVGRKFVNFGEFKELLTNYHMRLSICALPIYTIYLRGWFFSTDTASHVLNEESEIACTKVVSPRWYFICLGTTVRHPKSFPTLSTQQSVMQYEFSSVCTQQSGKYHRQILKLEIFFAKSNYLSFYLILNKFFLPTPDTLTNNTITNINLHYIFHTFEWFDIQLNLS